MKTIKWNHQARLFVRSLSLETRKEVGALIMVLQSGELLGEPQSKPMRVIHKNAYEIRVGDNNGQYRIIYVAVLKGVIIIPHAFMKKTQKTPKKEISLSIKRLKDILNESK